MKILRYISASKNAGDFAVTQNYIKVICKAFSNAGYKPMLLSKKTNTINKSEAILFDECKVAFPYAIKGYKNLIIWIQGIVPEEALLQGYSKLRYYIHSFIERTVLSKAKMVFFCSEYMKEHYQKKYNLKFEKYIIMPCFNETDIDEGSFNDSKKYKQNTFTYVGSLSKWQCFEKTVELYKEIEKELNKIGKKTKLYIFTQDEDQALSILNQKRITSFEIKYYPYDELGEHIRKIKYGFIIREDNEVNRVATPTKLSNYISHGIIPIYSPCLKSFDSYNEHSNGPAIKYDIDSNNINNLLESINTEVSLSRIHEWCKNTFESYYSSDFYIKKIENMIKEIF